MARTQHSTLGIIPPPTFPSATILRTPATSTSLTRLPGSFRSARIPDTSVSSSSFSAPTAAAISPAAACPASSAATVAMTGMWPDSMIGRSTVGSTRVTSPTNPREAASREGRAVSRRASLPQRPTAVAPARLMRETSCLFTLPTSTISTTSMVTASVTRSPLRNCGSTPTRASQELISGPPPWTSTGRRPTQDRRTRSRITDACSSGDFIAAPPYLTTTVLPLNRWMNGSASDRTSTRLSAGAAGGAATAATEAAETRRPPRRLRELDEAARGVAMWLAAGIGFGSGVEAEAREEGWGFVRSMPATGRVVLDEMPHPGVVCRVEWAVALRWMCRGRAAAQRKWVCRWGHGSRWRW
nr:unnamed protein product [Digitaria exilis]